ncbi:MAG: glycosyltransferase family 1 protein [Planctomycetota bacterium]|nr:MAG: glycosyltransferase family 1 protein [Planctomycetota bacterium]
MSVLHVINGEYYSGAERVQDLLAARLGEFGYRVDFVCLRPDLFPKRRKYTQAAAFEVPMKHRFDLRPVRAVAELIRAADYRIIHAHTPRSLMIAAAASRKTGVPLVYHVHSPAARDSTHRLRNALSAAMERVALRRASAVITVSESLARHMAWAESPKRRVVVVPNGVPAGEELVPRDPPAETWTIGTVALFRPRKGTEVLLQAVQRVRAAGKDVRLLAVGPFVSPEYEASLRDLADRLGIADAVEWTGFTSDVSTRRRDMDVFVLPSLFGEGLPMVVLEAMAEGIPVIASKVEGIPEVIRHGREGLLAEPGSVDDLVSQIESLMSGKYDYQTLRQAAFERQRDHYSDRSMARGTAAVYDSLCRSRNGD